MTDKQAPDSIPRCHRCGLVGHLEGHECKTEQAPDFAGLAETLDRAFPNADAGDIAILANCVAALRHAADLQAELEASRFAHGIQIDIARQSSDARAALQAKLDAAEADLAGLNAMYISACKGRQDFRKAFREQRDEFRKAEARLAECERDAERYRWLRQYPNNFFPEEQQIHGKELDIAIDAALGAQTK